MGELILRPPFAKLSSHQLLGMGAVNPVFAISAKVAFKCSTIASASDGIDAEYHATVAAANVGSLEKVKNIYRLLSRAPHPNVLYSILHVDTGMFLERFDTTLESVLRLPRKVEFPIQCRLILEITKALAWLETLGLAHGDLRPANILLEQQEHIKVCDFDGTVPVGQRMLAATEPFHQIGCHNNAYIAGPETEQFALASIMYNIRFACEPLAALESSLRVRKLSQNEFPTTTSDIVFGTLITEYWHGLYGSLADVDQAVRRILMQWPTNEDLCDSIGRSRVAELLEDCRTFLDVESRSAAGKKLE